MNTSQKYWIPGELPEHLQVGLSIPGKAPKTTGEHRNRLWSLLEKLAEELDDNVGLGAAARAAYYHVPDGALFLEGDRAPPITVVHILMESDYFTTVYLPAECLGPGVEDEELQERCHEAMFEDRLTNLTQD
ncbi:hypothetical protein ACFL07_00965 [Pseudomonadota bacterium]